MSLRLIGLALCLILAGPAARADLVPADGISAHLELPAGYCALGRSHPTEKELYELQERMQVKYNGVLLLAVPCQDVESVRNGELIKSWATWLINGPPGNHTKIAADQSREEVVAGLSAGFPSIDENKINDNVGEAAKKEGMGLTTKDISILANDKTALYVGQVATVENGGIKRELAVVIGFASMAGRLFTLNLNADYKDSGTVDALLAISRDTIGRSIAATDAQQAEKTVPAMPEKTE
jgi:hypothetical protein